MSKFYTEDVDTGLLAGPFDLAPSAFLVGDSREGDFRVIEIRNEVSYNFPRSALR